MEMVEEEDSDGPMPQRRGQVNTAIGGNMPPKKVPRSNFPETWLWDIVLVRYVFLFKSQVSTLGDLIVKCGCFGNNNNNYNNKSLIK